MHQTLYLSWGLNHCPSYLEAPGSPMNQVVSLIWPTLTISMYLFQASFFFRLFLFFLLFSTNKHERFTTCFKTCGTNSWFFPKGLKKSNLWKHYLYNVVTGQDISESIAEFFEARSIAQRSIVDNSVYNGFRLLWRSYENFYCAIKFLQC